MSMLDIEHARDLLSIKGGADVISLMKAANLRLIERLRPEFVVIGRVMGSYGAGERRPYFGAIPTKKGMEWAKELETKRDELERGWL